MDAIYTYQNYTEDSRPRLQFPTRTGRRTTYSQWLEHNYRLHHDDDRPAAAAFPTPAPAIVNHGRWLWQCPACLTAVQICADQNGAALPLYCPACFGQGFVQPTFPPDRAAIEEELMRQPGYRWNAPFRNWEPGWSLAYLQARTAAAQAQLDAGATYVRAASIGTPRTWSVGEVLTAANMNTYIREIQKDLIGTNGPVEFLSALVPASFTTAERNALTAQAGLLLFNSTLNLLENYDGSQWRTPLRYHQSQLFAAGQSNVTVTHNLGVKPVVFQAMYERVKDSEDDGFVLGDQVFPMQTQWPSSPGLQAWDVTTTQYDVAMAGDSNQSGLSTFRRAHIVPATGTPTSRLIELDNNPASTTSNGGWGVRAIAIG